MKVITYLGFTVLSIFIQFCVMDFIQEKIQISPVTHNITSQKETLSNLLKNISSKPHALYYRTNVMAQSLKSIIKNSQSNVYSNSSIAQVSLETTDISTTIFDVLYDENSTDIDSTSTTETYFTSTEFDNITEISFFEIKNTSSNVTNTTPKSSTKQCDCDLLYKVCDINCCCDQDCSDVEHKLFQCDGSGKSEIQNKLEIDGCLTHLFDIRRYGGSMLDNMFCVVKTNLPNKRNIKQNNHAIPQYYKWRSIVQKQTSYEFKKTLYKQADPIWLLKHGKMYYLDFPVPMINYYCTDRAPIVFLKEENIMCKVKLKDLEMFDILRNSEEALVISATEKTFNSSDLNCSNLHCINWTIEACYSGQCSNYEKDLNEASCTDTVCTNVAQRIDYKFYYYDSKIINATIKLHLKNISTTLPFLTQEINVNFYIANKSIDKIIEFSGNPGYMYGLPVLVSYVKSNHSDKFYNNTLDRRHILLPENKDGLCVSSNTSKNFLKFGLNMRTKCRYIYPHKVTKNNDACKHIQNDIIEMLRLNNNVSVAPFGNPRDITDDNWLSLNIDTNKLDPVYGEFNEDTMKLYCHNVIKQVSIIFTYANIDEKASLGQNKILSADYEMLTTNLSFIIDYVSTVITVDISFVDMTKPSLVKYAGSPQLNINLPKDFFFPFPSNSCFHVSNKCIVTIYCYVIFFANKITLE